MIIFDFSQSIETNPLLTISFENELTSACYLVFIPSIIEI